MKQKKSFFLTLIIFIVLIAGSAFAYSRLSSERSAGNLSSLSLSPSSEESTAQNQAETLSQTVDPDETETRQTSSETEAETKAQSEAQTQTRSGSDSKALSRASGADASPSKASQADASQPDASQSEASQPDASQTEPPQTEETQERDSSASNAQYTLAPDFTVTDAEGNDVSLWSLLGKPAVLNFWNSNCPPCKMEMPDFQEMYEELGDEVSFIMIDTVGAMGETKEKGAAYIEEEGFTFPVYFDTAQDAIYTYGIAAFPTTFFISSDGYLIAGAQGMIDKEIMQKGIDMILEQ